MIPSSDVSLFVSGMIKGVNATKLKLNRKFSKAIVVNNTTNRVSFLIKLNPLLKLSKTSLKTGNEFSKVSVKSVFFIWLININEIIINDISKKMTDEKFKTTTKNPDIDTVHICLNVFYAAINDLSKLFNIKV